MAFPPSSQTTTLVAVPAAECAKLGQKLLDRGAKLQGGARWYLGWVVVVLGVGLVGIMFAAYLPKFDLEVQQTSATQELINTKREEIDAINMMLSVLRNAYLLSVELAADGRVGIIVGQRSLGQASIVLTTADFGTTWTGQDSSAPLLADIALTETGRGIAAGFTSVLTTADFGATWTEQPARRDDTPLQGVALTETGRGIAVGGGIVLTTTDFGATWTEQDSSAAPRLADIALTETGRGIAVGAGIVLTTADFGATWAEQARREGASLEGVALTETGRGIAVGPDIVLTTADFGATWTTVEEKALGQKETLFQEIRALETGPGEPLTATQELMSRASIRLAILVLVLFLVQVLVGLNRYNTRLAAFYLARADTLLLLSAGDDPIQLPLDVAERLTQMLSPDQLDFGRSPKVVAQQAMDLARNLLASRNVQNR